MTEDSYMMLRLDELPNTENKSIVLLIHFYLISISTLIPQ